MSLAARLLTTCLAISAATLGLAVPAGAAVIDPLPIGPNQGFTGQVNKVHVGAVITVFCPGPAFPGQTGHPVGGQTVSAVPGAVSTGGGYTGSLGRSIVVIFPPTATTGSVTLTGYYEYQPIPTTLLFPCSGTGTVRYRPEPTSMTARDDTVTVTFENIAVSP
jgi:hypothetical protein